MREIKFRAWDKEVGAFAYMIIGHHSRNPIIVPDPSWKNLEEWLQYTGLKDKNGKEIYELMELNNKWKVSYKAPKYILIDISTGDIIDFNEQNKYEITREYTDIPKDPKGSVD